MSAAPGAPRSPLLAALARLIDETAAEARGPMRDRLLAARAEVSEPLRVAFVGRVKSGKSTLVNALIGSRVAPTGVGETTMVTAWYRYGYPERADVHLVDGTSFQLPLTPHGGFPEELGVDHAQVRIVHVFLSIRRLRRRTVVDTPGLNSLTAEVSAGTERLLDPAEAWRDPGLNADARALVVNGPLKADEDDTVKRLRRVGGSAVNAVGVLTRADGVQRGDGWAEAARGLAREIAQGYSGDLADVVPVVGLLAETARTGRLSEDDAEQLLALAGRDEESVRRMLFTDRRFADVDAASPPSAAARRRLWDRLDRLGIERSVHALRRDARGAEVLRRYLLRISNIVALEHALDGAFARRPDALKARRIHGMLRGLAYPTAAETDVEGLASLRAALRSRLEAFVTSSQAHAIAELEMLHRVLIGEVELPDELRPDVERIAGGRTLQERLGIPTGDAARLHAAALEGNARWTRFHNWITTGADAKTVAHVMRTSYELMLDELERAPAATA